MGSLNSPAIIDWAFSQLGLLALFAEVVAESSGDADRACQQDLADETDFEATA